MRLTFDAAAVRHLMDHARTAGTVRPAMEQLFDPRYRLDGREPPDGVFPTVEDIDVARLPRSLWLVGDMGVYLMSSGSPPQPSADGSKGNQVVFADQVNPRTLPFDSWYEAKRRAFGGDDGVVVLPLEDLECFVPPTGVLTMDLTPDSLTLVGA
jgi:hypothetical protein